LIIRAILFNIYILTDKVTASTLIHFSSFSLPIWRIEIETIYRLLLDNSILLCQVVLIFYNIHFDILSYATFILFLQLLLPKSNLYLQKVLFRSDRTKVHLTIKVEFLLFMWSHNKEIAFLISFISKNGKSNKKLVCAVHSLRLFSLGTSICS